VTVAAQQYLAEKFRRVIDYARQEYDMTYEELIGALAMLAMDMHAEHIKITEDADDGDS